MSAELGPITVRQLVQYAGSSGDFNPLHWDPDFARSAGFDRPVVVGSLSASLLLSTLARSVDLAELRRYQVKFTAPVLADSALIVDVEAEESEDGCSTLSAKALIAGTETVALEATFVVGGPVADLSVLPDDFVALDEPYAWPVEEGAARFFGRAVGDTSAVTDGSPVHPTFAQTALRWTLAQRDFVERLDFDFTRMVHGSSTFEFAAEPLRVGERLWVTEGHSGRRSVSGRHGLMNLADAHLVIRDSDGDVRVHVTYRLVERPAR